jgi:hypothetical protein
MPKSRHRSKGLQTPLTWQWTSSFNDRLSFTRFLALGLADRVRDARTIWLTTAGAIKGLFEKFDAMLRQAGQPCRVRLSMPA